MKHWNTRDGFVLIAVIWVVGLLALMSAAFVAKVKSNTVYVKVLTSKTRLEAAADGMARLLALRVTVPTQRDIDMPKNGITMSCEWNGEITITYSVQDQGGLIDLNTVSPLLLNHVLQGLGKTEAEARAIAAEIDDFKDADSVTSNGDTEVSHYPAQSLGPNNGPFVAIEELDRIPGMDQKLAAAMMPIATVFSQQMGFDQSRSPKSLRDAMLAAGIDQSALAKYNSPSPTRVYAITVTAHAKSNQSFTRNLIFSSTGQPDRPIAYLKWVTTRGDSSAEHKSAKPMPCL